MRRFHSYGPVDPSEHFFVERRALVEECVTRLVGNPDTGGSFFTLWAPRQTGKTWLMRRAIEEIRRRHGDRFLAGSLLMQGVIGKDDGEELFFRAMYLSRSTLRGSAGTSPAAPPNPRSGYVLHGLALVGVRAVLGVESERGSPFNVQRSLHVPNLTQAEVEALFAQYQAESGQNVEPEAAAGVFEATRGQPGLTSWLGELLTETYNPGPGAPITASLFRTVYERACHIEWNNTVLNLIKKARGRYRSEVVSLFTNPDVPFSLDKDWCSYLYMNGIIDRAPDPDDPLGARFVCRFSSPFVQRRLFAALTDDMFGDRGPILAIEPGDMLEDVLVPGGLCLPPLLERYRGYLERLKAPGIDPWRGQPRRRDLHLTEAVGHFHLYAWLRDAGGRLCVISPEFPTGNGKVDLVLRTRDERVGLIEVKSFVDMFELGEGRAQAAAYAKKLGLKEATLAVFVPLDDAAIPPQIPGESEIAGVKVVTVAIGWV